MAASMPPSTPPAPSPGPSRYGTFGGGGTWTFTFTVNLAPGSYTLFAQAQDNFGVFSDLISLTLQVV
jgi:hypothetical protein